MKIQVGFYASRAPDGSFLSSSPIFQEIDEDLLIKRFSNNEGREIEVRSFFPDELEDVLLKKITALKSLERKGKRNGKRSKSN